MNEKIRPIRGSVPALSMSKIYRIPRPIIELDQLIEVPSWLSDRQAGDRTDRRTSWMTTAFAVGQFRDPVNVRIFDNLGLEDCGVPLGLGR